MHLQTIEYVNKDMIYKFKLAYGFPYLTLFGRIVITSALQHDLVNRSH